jgi:CubicO group peptidase (beta-lactamase class C family)
MKWLVSAAWVMACVAPCGAHTADPRIDAVFSRWNTATTPGCALGVVRNGSAMYARGYGSANLELGVPITARTVFDIGSVSKQFTAMSIVLLAGDGRLSLDDEIHKFLPELPPYGEPVTLRLMLHHLSGLPSYTDLFDLAGVPEIDRTTDEDALALIARQKKLNFAPGRQYLYSDTNYFLLALVVRRVSGEPLSAFARRRIFQPLGMTSTHFHDDHRMIVPRRATGYAPRPGGGFEIDMSSFEELGDGSVMTTVEDMIRWDRNFDTPVVGGERAIRLLQELGRRSDGSLSRYAMGLILDRYRDIPRVQHTGEWVGYRSSFLRFPTKKLSVIVLCNMVGELDPLVLSERVADVVLPGAPAQAQAPAHAPAATSMTPTAAQLDAYAGAYWNATTYTYLRFVASALTLSLDDGDMPRPLHYTGHGEFIAQSATTRFVFHADREPTTVELIDDDSDPTVLERSAAPWRSTDLTQYEGTYYSRDLGVSWTIKLRDNRLMRSQWMFAAQALEPVLPDIFIGDLSEGSYSLKFSRDHAGEIEGFEVGTVMVRPIRFSRCTPALPDDAGPIAIGCKVDDPELH